MYQINIEQKMRSHLTDEFQGVIKYLHENHPTLKVHIAYNEYGGCVEGLLLIDPQMINMYRDTQRLFLWMPLIN